MAGSRLIILQWLQGAGKCMEGDGFAVLVIRIVKKSAECGLCQFGSGIGYVLHDLPDIEFSGNGFSDGIYCFEVAGIESYGLFGFYLSSDIAGNFGCSNDLPRIIPDGRDG